MEGDGEILHIEAKPAYGEREIAIDKDTGLIDDETFKILPEPYRVARYGASKNNSRITFDDGPDPSGPRHSRHPQARARPRRIFPDWNSVRKVRQHNPAYLS